MWLSKVRGYVLPGAAEDDAGFRERILNLSRQGLFLIAAVEILVPLFLLLAQFVMAPDSAAWRLRMLQAGCVMAIGFATLIVARCKPRRPRLVGWISGFLTGAVLISFSLLLAAAGEVGDYYIPGQITTVLLVAVGALPLLPLHTFTLGLSLEAYYRAAGLAAVHSNMLDPVDPSGMQSAFILMIALLSAALTALLYAERRSSFAAHQEALRASETLCKAQSRALVSENAASLARLSAALSHELNSPIGALRSAVDTLLSLTVRQATAPPEEQHRLVQLQLDLRRSVEDSAKRLQQIVARLQRFTNLDKSEVQPADVNDLVGDVVALLEPKLNGVKVELDLHPVPSLLCRPQQLSAVLSSVLQNAAEAMAEGGCCIRISTHAGNGLVEIEICDNGRGLPPEEISTIFDPGFRVSGGRVSTGNWSLFSSRQIVREHGGDIHIRSLAGKGTTVNISLPCTRQA